LRWWICLQSTGQWSGRTIDKISVAIDDAQPGMVKTIDCGVFFARVKRDSG